jgi:hypothetical protein
VENRLKTCRRLDLGGCQRERLILSGKSLGMAQSNGRSAGLKADDSAWTIGILRLLEEALEHLLEAKEIGSDTMLNILWSGRMK